MAAGYSVLNTADVALVGATAKTILACVQAANIGARITELGVSFDGISATAEPVTVELMRSDGSTAGTSTAFTVLQTRGLTRTAQCTAAVNYSAEPTALVAIKTWLVHPQTGLTIQFPLGREPERVGAGAFVLRLTAPVAVNARGWLEFEEG